ncbi:MAG: alanine--tRNA ligase [Lysobacterales bacterium]
MSAATQLSSNQIRKAFLDYFAGKGHRVVASSPLVPGNDPTLLFTNSGMVQFKDTFLGAEQRDYSRAATAQRCLRAGGKHNDLDQVGYTARHHTFFEMLGNFSFGDYFKSDAINFAWELLTGVYGLPAEKLWITVYHTDDEAFDHWHQVIGVPAERIIRIGDNKGAPYASDNFWQMADTGPCGPCSEIFFDHGEHIAGGPPGSPDEDGDRYIEIWNLVFMQFERHADGRLTPLPKPCVDTGMGLERLSAVLQHVHSNYEIDSFVHLLKAAAALTSQDGIDHPSLRVIADHIRACSFMIVDGVLPGNEGRGYVLRRIIRRALRHGHKLGAQTGFFHQMVQPLIDVMGEAYPELVARQAMVTQALAAEEERFAETLDAGMKVFEEIAARSQGTIAGADVFKLYDTYGFPADLTADVARERGLAVDSEGFEVAMEAAREKSRQASQFGGGFGITAEQSQGLASTRFLGYHSLQEAGCRVQRILVGNEARGALNAGEEAVIVLDQTPFYAESGGQVGDTGWLLGEQGRFRVLDTVKLAGVYHGHRGVLEEGRLALDEPVQAGVDAARRQATILNHSATHLLHAALREELGEHVTQKGSLVAPDRLRFDFSHFQPVTPEQLARIERQVNRAIRANAQAEAQEMAFDQAIEAGAMALFGEKYGDRVRVLKMGEFSTELCGGTHVSALGDIGLFRITAETGVAAGIRRIEAVTGEGALEFVARREQELARTAGMVGSGPDAVADKVAQLLEKLRGTERELESLKAKAASAASGDLASRAVEVNGIRVLAERLEGVEARQLREMIDALKSKLGDCAVLLAAARDGKVSLAAGVAGKGLQSVKAGDLLQHVARQINGKGGGRPDMAQGGGDDLPQLPALLAEMPAWVAAQG